MANDPRVDKLIVHLQTIAHAVREVVGGSTWDVVRKLAEVASDLEEMKGDLKKEETPLTKVPFRSPESVCCPKCGNIQRFNGFVSSYSDGSNPCCECEKCEYWFKIVLESPGSR